MKIRKLSAILLAGALMTTTAVASFAAEESSQTESTESIVDESGNLVIEGTKVTGLTEQGKEATEIVIPEGVTWFYVNVFQEAVNLENVTFPSSLIGFFTDGYMTVGFDHFAYNTKLKCIEVSENNKYIYSKDGVLIGEMEIEDFSTYDDRSNSIIRYPIGKPETSYSIPDGVEHVGFCAFANCKNLENITIPGSIKSIEINGFAGCSNLKTITVPDGVDCIRTGAFRDCTSLETAFISDSIEKIEYSAFDNCTNLKDVYFEGSQEQLIEIINGEDLKNVFCDATIHYNYVAPTDTESSTDSNSSDAEASTDSEASSDNSTAESTTDSTDTETSTDSNSSGTTTTPDTGVAGISLTLGVVALAGAAVVLSKKKR